MATIGDVTGLRPSLPCEVKGKVQYKSKGAAEAHIRALLKRPERLRDGETLNPYKCKHCYRWHVGHNRPKEERQPNPVSHVAPVVARDAVRDDDHAVRYPFTRAQTRRVQ